MNRVEVMETVDFSLLVSEASCLGEELRRGVSIIISDN